MNPIKDIAFENSNFAQFVQEISVILVSHEQMIKETVQNISVKITSNGDVVLHDLIAKLKTLGFQLDRSMISYYCAELLTYFYCGIDPLPRNLVIPKVEYSNLKPITLKYRQTGKSVFQDLINSQPMDKISSKDVDESINKKSAQSRRMKERKIGEVVQKVSLWRKLYTGFYDNNGKLLKMSLDEAANKVGISKKSLDDYLLQIRFGRKFSFNFNENTENNFGVLRAFVKQQKFLSYSMNPEPRQTFFDISHKITEDNYVKKKPLGFDEEINTDCFFTSLETSDYFDSID